MNVLIRGVTRIDWVNGEDGFLDFVVYQWRRGSWEPVVQQSTIAPTQTPAYYKTKMLHRLMCGFSGLAPPPCYSSMEPPLTAYACTALIMSWINPYWIPAQERFINQ